MPKTKLEELDHAYELAEAAFLEAVRGDAERHVLATLARAVATAAAPYNVEAWRKFHAGEEDAWIDLGDLTERTELLEELWQDMAAAYEA